MKTIKNVQKTENKKTLNAVSKTFAVVASLVLLSLTSSANGFWKQVMVNNSFGKMAVMMDDHALANNVLPLLDRSLSTLDSGIAAKGVFGLTEQNMNSESPFKIENRTIARDFFEPTTDLMEVDAERPLTLEPWMIGDNFWETGKVDAEPNLKLEEWMTNERIWLIK